MALRNPGPRLKRFREARQLSLREAARQLHVAHPALKDWEDEPQTPSQPYRDAIEVWTGGDVKAADWPLEGREKQIAENAASVKPAVPRASESGSTLKPSTRSTGTS
jgi:transcriptional regulator with XRE-family HTH domain